MGTRVRQMRYAGVKLESCKCPVLLKTGNPMELWSIENQLCNSWHILRRWKIMVMKLILESYGDKPEFKSWLCHIIPGTLGKSPCFSEPVSSSLKHAS